MRVRYSPLKNQHVAVCRRIAGKQILAFLIPLFFLSCNRSSEETPIVPPATHPLTREYIGFGVVNASFTHLLSEYGPSGVSQGYIRRGTIVRIVERVQVNNRGRVELWVLAESNYQGTVSRGWLQETNVTIYPSESQANTASRTMSQ